jgi:type II secretory pathway pseudopilin PulG
VRLGRQGVVLLEVLVALVVLSAAGLGVVSAVGAGLRGERDAQTREHVLAVEERVIAALTLLTREDLDRRIGPHPIGEFVVDVERPEATLYRIAIAQAASAHLEDLVTVVYREEPRRAP